MAGTNVYDVMYHQHFLGTFKIVPLPAVGEYVYDRILRGTQFPKQFPIIGLPWQKFGYFIDIQYIFFQKDNKRSVCTQSGILIVTLC